MKKLSFFVVLLSALVFSMNLFAEMDDVRVERTDQAKQLLLSKDFVQDEWSNVHNLALTYGTDVDLTWITSTWAGIREDLGIDEDYNVGMKHQLLFINDAETLQCSFSVYIIWQDTLPLSMNSQYSKVTSEARCFNPAEN